MNKEKRRDLYKRLRELSGTSNYRMRSYVRLLFYFSEFYDLY